ncbi:hypothetical protein [Nocardiopsis alba]|uniref:variant leucine-rich repeat-containing protein n=1 Tax=Nocardiopsis alba TaxID=53437 RepID=UPI0033B2B4DE
MNSPGPRDPAGYSAQELADPRIDSETLRRIAAVRPDLWPSILRHPNCDGGLAAHIRQNTPQTGPPSQTGPRPPMGGPPQSGPQVPMGGGPLQTGPQGPPGTGPQGPVGGPQGGPMPPMGGPGRPPMGGAPQTGAQPSPAAQQAASNAKDLANGAKTYFADTVAPAAMSAARTVSQRSGEGSDAVHWTIWVRFAVPVIALIGAISLFMPIASASYGGYSVSVNYFSEEVAAGEGAIMLIGFIAVIAFSVVSLMTGKKWAAITAGVLAILFGLIGTINGFGTGSSASGQAYASAGAGAILLGISGLLLLIAAIVTLLPKKVFAAGQQPAQPQGFAPPQQYPQQQPPLPQQPQQQGFPPRQQFPPPGQYPQQAPQPQRPPQQQEPPTKPFPPQQP